MMANQADFSLVFNRLKQAFQSVVPYLVVKADTADNYYLIAPPAPNRPKEVFFGAVQVKKNYVSYHLMPLYMFPQLLEGISEPLKKRMQGKACFNFTKVDENIFEELHQLTVTGFEYARQQYIS
jgi:hypothetical protein